MSLRWFLTAMAPIRSDKGASPILTQDGVRMTVWLVAILIGGLVSLVSTAIAGANILADVRHELALIKRDLIEIDEWHAKRPTNEQIVTWAQQVEANTRARGQGGRWTREDAIETNTAQDNRMTQMASNFSERVKEIVDDLRQHRDEAGKLHDRLLEQDNQLYRNQERAKELSEEALSLAKRAVRILEGSQKNTDQRREQ